MSDADIDKAVKEAAEFEAQDKKRKEGIDARNEADSMAFQTQKALDEVGDKISASEKESIENEIKALRAILDRTNAESMSDSDIDEIKAAKEKLMNIAQPVFAKMYEQAQGAAGAAGAGSDMSNMGGQQSTSSNNYGDDVVDGDYKEV